VYHIQGGNGAAFAFSVVVNKKSAKKAEKIEQLNKHYQYKKNYYGRRIVSSFRGILLTFFLLLIQTAFLTMG